MNETFIRDMPANQFDLVLLWMIRPENKNQEMFFSSDMIDAICKQYHYPCYKFAHSPEGNIYKRMSMWPKAITMEYIVMKNPKKEGFNSYLQQFSYKGQLVYRRPDNPIGEIYVL